MNESERALRDVYAILEAAGWNRSQSADQLLTGLARLEALAPRLTPAQSARVLHALREVERHLKAALAYRKMIEDLLAAVEDD